MTASRILLCVSTLLTAAAHADDAPAVISLAEIDGRSWLTRPDGTPFFAHGITHVGTVRHGIPHGRIAAACRELGFNAFGYGCPEPLKQELPYIEGINYLVPISTYRGEESFKFIDIFDPQQQRIITGKVRNLCEKNRDNPNLIGYCWTDLAAWPRDDKRGRSWVDFIRELPPAAPGRRAYDDFVATHPDLGPEAVDKEFLRLIARTYFRVVGEANFAHDPHHLVFGDRFAFPTVLPVVVEEMLPYVDAIAVQPPFQPDFPRARFDQIHKLTGKPIVICDFAIRFRDGDKAIRGWRPLEDDDAAGKAYADYVYEAFETPYVVGVFWCNLVDSPPSFGKGGIKQGLFGDDLALRPGLSRAVRIINGYLEANTPPAPAQ